MIYKSETTGVFLVENDMNVNDDFIIGYRVGKVSKEATIKYRYLPTELIDEFAKVTNKIARHIEHDNMTERG